MPAPTPPAPRFGLGLRKPHYAAVLTGGAPLDFVEVISENFMGLGGRPRDVLHRARALHPVALHGVSLSPGSTGGLDADYLTHLRALIDEIEPAIVSDHVCWTREGPGALQSHDLLPLPYTDEALGVISANIDRAQTALGRQILIENPSSYVDVAACAMGEAQFIAELCARTGCGLLLDVNNVHVSATNHGWDVAAYLAALPLHRVGQIHLAGHSTRDVAGRALLVDTHDAPVPVAVWALYAEVMARLAAIDVAPWVMIERDDAIPPLDDLLAELALARGHASAVPTPSANIMVPA